jgi:hypothetical protein
MANVATRVVQGLRKHVPLIKFRGKSRYQQNQNVEFPPNSRPEQELQQSNVTTQNISNFSSSSSPVQFPKSSTASYPSARVPKRRPLTDEEIKIIELGGAKPY